MGRPIPQNAVVSSRFVFHGVPNPGSSVVPTTSTLYVTLWLCVISLVVCYLVISLSSCVSRGNAQNRLMHALRTPKKLSRE